jgi:hypothetical protein
VVEGIRHGLSQAQILLNLLPSERSASAIRSKKKELQAKFGVRVERYAKEKRTTPLTPAPPVPLPKRWTSDDTGMLRKCMSEGLSDRDIQAMHFPNRTEDSVIGKLRKLRAATLKLKGGAVTAKLPTSRSQYVGSSPVTRYQSSSQNVQRSSPAQAAFTRKSEATIDALPVVQEDDVDDQSHVSKADSADQEAAKKDEFDEEDFADVDLDDAADSEPEVADAKDDNFELSDVEVQLSDDEDINEPASDVDDAVVRETDVEEDAMEQNGVEDFYGMQADVDDAIVDVPPEDVDMPQDSAVNDDIHVEDAAGDLAGKDIVMDSAYPGEVVSPAGRRIAFVALAERPDMNDVIDCRAMPVTTMERSEADVRKAAYEATIPPFRPGQEDDEEGMLHSTKLALWREAYTRCRGDAEAAYREYENLRTDEHMIQAVCNLDYEMINAIKAVRMRRRREDAIREGRTPPKTKVRHQPQHLDLYGEKEYSQWYVYTPWAEETEEMYLNEPIVFGPRPVPGAPEEEEEDSDPMDDVDYDEDDEEDEDEYDLPYLDVEEGPYLDVEEGQPRATVEKPFHGHISEMEDDDEDEGASRNFILSHREVEAEAAAKIAKKSRKQRRLEAAEEEISAPAASKKRKQPATEESMPTPTSKKQKKDVKEPAQESVPSPPVKEQKKAKKSKPTLEESVSPPVEVLPAEEEVVVSPVFTEEWQTAQEELSPPAKKSKKERKMKPIQEETMPPPSATENQKPADNSSMAPPSSKKQKKQRTSQEEIPPLLSAEEETQPAAHVESMPPPFTAEEVTQPAAQIRGMPPPTSQTETMPPPPSRKQKKAKKTSKEQPAPEKTMPPPTTKKAHRGSKVTPIVGKKGELVSKSALRRQRKALRRSDTSTTSEATVGMTQEQSLPAVHKLKADVFNTEEKVASAQVEHLSRKQRIALRRSATFANSEAMVEVMNMQSLPAVHDAKANMDGVKEKSVGLEENNVIGVQGKKAIKKNVVGAEPHPEDDPSQWMRDIVKNAKHKPPPVRRASPPPIDPNNLFGRGDPSDDSESESD